MAHPVLDWLRRIFAVPDPFPPAPSPPPVPTAPPPTSNARAELFAAINAQRTAYGLSPFLPDPSLDAMAQSWAGTMAASGIMDHGDFPGRISHVYPNSSGAEDIAEGYPDVPSVVSGWMSSPGHRANILGNFNRLGVGIATAADGALYFVADFDSHS